VQDVAPCHRLLGQPAFQIHRRNLQWLVDDRPGAVRLDQDDATGQAGAPTARSHGELDPALGQ
jgi:hypothetical protein